MFPTIRGTAQQFKKCPAFKATGENTFAGTVYNASPKTLAHIHYPIFLKSHIHRSPPIFYRGGQIAALYKGSGSMYKKENHRDVTLANLNGKNFGSLIRKCALPKLKNKALPGMYGAGLNSGSTEIAHLHLIAIMEYAQTKNMSIAILFADISSAFASLCRDIVFYEDLWDDDNEFIAMLELNGINKNIALRFLEFLHENPIWEKGNIKDEHILAMLRAMHKYSWSTFEYIKGVLHT